MVADMSLHGCRILVAEDEYMLADELAQELDDRGADVIGPAPTVEQAIGLARATERLHGAILDVNLGGALVYPVAEVLHDRGVPIVFTTGYDADVVPAQFAGVPRCEKPVNIRRVLATLDRAVHAR